MRRTHNTPFPSEHLRCCSRGDSASASPATGRLRRRRLHGPPPPRARFGYAPRPRQPGWASGRPSPAEGALPPAASQAEGGAAPPLRPPERSRRWGASGVPPPSPVWGRSAVPGRMEAAYVYRLAGALGSELQRLSDRFGTASLAGLVPQVVRLLELLETLAADGTPPGSLPGASSDEGLPGAAAERSLQVAEERLAEAQERERRLQSRLTQLEEEQQRALSRLARVQDQEEGPGCRERELMLQLKEVVDHQRDKIRAQDHEIQRKAQDMEALQEQLNRFMTVNENLRRKVAVVQAQLRSALERKGEAEALCEVERRGRTSTPTEQEEGDVGGAAAPPEGPPDQCTFSKEELQQILQERNELKTSLFLVEEELAYYQRELLNGERVPALLLHAVKSAIKKQRKKIWAKMLGTEEESMGREEEEEEEGEGWPIGSPGSDHTDGRLPESRIKSFFSQWYRRSSQPSPTESRPGTWEIISAEDVGPGEEESEEAPPSGSSSPATTSTLP